MLALLLFAGGFALGLFFGWLLHRERVERVLYEDVVRARDRATSTLAETSARLELANRDAVRLREQLTAAQHELAERDTTIARLRREADAEGAADDADADASGFEEAEVTEEVVPTSEFPLGDGTPDEERELIEEAEEDLELVDAADDGGPLAGATGDADTDPVAIVALEAPTDEAGAEDDAASVGGTGAAEVGAPPAAGEVDSAAPPAADDIETEAVDEAELAVVDEPDVEDEDLDRAGAAPDQAVGDDDADEVAADTGDTAVLLDELPDDGDADDDDEELVAAGTWYDREPQVEGDAPSATTGPAPPDDEPAAAADDAPTSGIGTPLVLEADPDDGASPVVPDEAAAAATGDGWDADVGTDAAVADGDTGADDAAAQDAAAGDDLRRISGVGPALERELRSEGITSYRALALLDEQTIAELGARRPRLVTRLRRDGWVAQARRLHEEAHGTAP